MKKLKLIIGHALRVSFNLQSVWQFIYLNFFSKHVKSDYVNGCLIYPYGNCVFEFKSGSLISLEGPFIFGSPSIKGSKKTSYLSMGEDAALLIHSKTYITDGCDIQILKGAMCEMNCFHSNTGLELTCGQRIVFNGEVTCGRHVRIKDNNGHFVSYKSYPKSAPVIVQNHTWLCTGSTIGPGVTIGEGTVVADNANVINNVPPHSFCVGNPAKVIVDDIVFTI